MPLSAERRALEIAVKALQWALPLARLAMEDCRQRRLQAGHSFGTKRLGLYDDEVSEMETRCRALADIRALVPDAGGDGA